MSIRNDDVFNATAIAEERRERDERAQREAIALARAETKTQELSLYEIERVYYALACGECLEPMMVKTLLGHIDWLRLQNEAHDKECLLQKKLADQYRRDASEVYTALTRCGAPMHGSDDLALTSVQRVGALATELAEAKLRLTDHAKLNDELADAKREVNRLFSASAKDLARIVELEECLRSRPIIHRTGYYVDVRDYLPWVLDSVRLVAGPIFDDEPTATADAKPSEPAPLPVAAGAVSVAVTAEAGPARTEHREYWCLETFDHDRRDWQQSDDYSPQDSEPEAQLDALDLRETWNRQGTPGGMVRVVHVIADEVRRVVSADAEKKPTEHAVLCNVNTHEANVHGDASTEELGPHYPCTCHVENGRETGSLVAERPDNPGPTGESSSVKGVAPHSQGASLGAANGALPQSGPGKASASDTRLSNPLEVRAEQLADEAGKRFRAEFATLVEDIVWKIAGTVAYTYVEGRAEERRDVVNDLRDGIESSAALLADRFSRGEHVAKADGAS